MAQVVRDRIRRFLGIRSDRALPRRGSRPAIGAHIALGDLRMTVQAGFGDELWVWLMEGGWRELRYRPEHRRYRDVPSVCVRELIDTPTSERLPVFDAALARASGRPMLGDPNAVPPYIVRS
jgi:hypothetical protein